MIQQKKVITVLIGGLVLCATLHADMMQSLRWDPGYASSLSVCDRAVLQHTSLPSPFDCLGVTDLDSLPVRFLSVSNDDAGQANEAKPVQVLADGQSSFSLCLSALLGVVLCWSAPFVKRLHFGCLPEWYYRGGPSQIGNSLAISPDCLCFAPVYWFIPPDGGIEDSMPKYRQKIGVCLWRRSDFTPAVLAPRGPPYMS